MSQTPAQPVDTDLSQLDLFELIDLLEPVPEPPPVAMWPQTVGWLYLAGVLLALLGWQAWRQWQRYRANAYRRQALAELNMANGEPARIAQILRRTALAAYPRHQVASLYGLPWLEFLDQQFDGEGFCQGAGQLLATAPYRADLAKRPDSATRAERDALAALARQWIATHRAAILGGDGYRHD